MSRYTYARTAKVNFDTVTHKAAEAEKKISEAYLALHSFKAGLDAMDEVPSYLTPIYKQCLKAIDKVTSGHQEAVQLAGMTRKVLQSMR